MLQNFCTMLFGISPIFCLLCLYLCFSKMHCAFILCIFSVCREALHMIECKWRSVTSTVTCNNSNSLKLGFAPDFVGILEQGIWGHIFSPFEPIDILLSNIFVVLYANRILCIISD